jgi:hypothetical protein
MKLGLGLGLGLGSFGGATPDPGAALLATMDDYWLGTSLADGATTDPWVNQIGGRSSATLGVGPTNTRPTVSGGLLTGDGTDDGVSLPSDSQPALIIGTSTLTIGVLASTTNSAQTFRRWYSAESANNNGFLIAPWSPSGLAVAARVGDGTTTKTATASNLVSGRLTLIVAQMSTTHIRAFTDDNGFGADTPLSGLTGDLTRTGSPRLFQSQIGGGFAQGTIGAAFLTTDLLDATQLGTIATYLRGLYT